MATASQFAGRARRSACGLLTLDEPDEPDEPGETGETGEAGALDVQAAASVVAATIQTAAALATKNRVRGIMAVLPCSPR